RHHCYYHPLHRSASHPGPPHLPPRRPSEFAGSTAAAMQPHEPPHLLVRLPDVEQDGRSAAQDVGLFELANGVVELVLLVSRAPLDRKSTRLNSSPRTASYAAVCSNKHRIR